MGSERSGAPPAERTVESPHLDTIRPPCVDQPIASSGPADVDKAKGLSARSLLCDLGCLVIFEPIEERNVLALATVRSRPIAQPPAGERLVEVERIGLRDETNAQRGYLRSIREVRQHGYRPLESLRPVQRTDSHRIGAFGGGLSVEPFARESLEVHQEAEQ